MIFCTFQKVSKRRACKLLIHSKFKTCLRNLLQNLRFTCRMLNLMLEFTGFNNLLHYVCAYLKFANVLTYNFQGILNLILYACQFIFDFWHMQLNLRLVQVRVCNFRCTFDSKIQASQFTVDSEFTQSKIELASFSLYFIYSTFKFAYCEIQACRISV